LPTVLVADDNSNIQKMVTLALKDQGIEVIAVGNGEAAVRKLGESIPDLVLADIFMPVRNGYEVCEYVKKDERFAHIPVVLLVGAFDPLDEHEVERVHADGVLKKPFVPPDPLIGLVKSLLAKIAAKEAVAAAEQPASEKVAQGTADRVSTDTVELPRMEFPVRGAASQVERTQQLSANDISKILERGGPLGTQRITPPVETDGDDYATRPAMIDIHGDEAPLAFEDMLESADKPPEQETSTEEKGEGVEETAGADDDSGGTGYAEESPAALQTTEEAATAEEIAAINYGGIQDEAKQPDPEAPPIAVDFGPSEPMEIITDETPESSTVLVEPASDVVSSSGEWMDQGAKQTAPAEAHAEAPAVERAAAPAAEEFAVAAPESESEPATAAPFEDFEETTQLPAHILEAEVRRAQEIAARVALQNREREAKETEAFSIAAAAIPGTSIASAISAVDDMLARHMTSGAAAMKEEAPAARVEEQVAAPPHAAVVSPPAEARVVVAPTQAPTQAMFREDIVEAISERVLAQLDPYLIEKISKEIIRPIVEALIKHELEKLQ
jgi:CheY-like chemotaxis protein